MLNLSLVGMACSLNKVTTLITVKALLKNIQLILRGARCMVSGVVTDIKQTDKGESIYVILFDHKGMENRIKEKIHTFIYNCLQEKMQEEIMELKGTKTKAEKETRLKTDKVVKEVKAANDAVI